MIREVRTSEPASLELTAAVRWYESHRAGLGSEFLDAVDETLALIRSQPHLGSVTRHDDRTRRLLISRFPFQVVYRVEPQEVVVVAFAHTRRRPGYWKKRT